MSDGTSIEWSEASWNPIRARVGDRVGWHCEILSPGCEHCYAEAINHRLGTGDDYLRKSRRSEVFLDEKTLTQPLRWKRPRRIFVCSMSDLFGEWVPDEMLDRIFAVMALCPQHQFQVLTKRAERMRDYMRPYDLRRADSLGEKVMALGYDDPLELLRWPLPNVWLGVSVEDQRRADGRIPALLDTPAAVRWVSAEPLLGPVCLDLGCTTGKFWVVVGGESGPGARPLNIEWVRDIIAQCKAAGVACFVKQLGTHPIIADVSPYNGGFPCGTFFGNRTGIKELNGREVLLRDRKGGNPEEWEPDLRVREYPT